MVPRRRSGSWGAAELLDVARIEVAMEGGVRRDHYP